jgi:hypothetical protein
LLSKAPFNPAINITNLNTQKPSEAEKCLRVVSIYCCLSKILTVFAHTFYKLHRRKLSIKCVGQYEILLTIRYTKVNFRASMPIKSYNDGYREIIVVAHCLLSLIVKRFLMGVFKN